MEPTASAHETDEDLVARLGRGDEEALRALHRRYASLVFTVAARVVDPATAEEVVQDVFVTLWKKHETFEPARGAFRSWVAQIARRRALNERRRKQGRGHHGEESLAELSDESLQPDEAQWLAHRKAVIRAAVDALPTAERQALSLAYFDELTHEQISLALRTPLGTTKTRIRTALRRLGPLLLVALSATVALVILRRREERASRSEQALRMVTASDVVPIRLEPAAGVPADAHGNYRTRAGASVAVLTTSHLPRLGPPQRYVAWARRGDAWRLLGPVVVEDDGRSLLVSEVTPGEEAPDEIRVTDESTAPGDAPRGPVVLTSSRRP
jgi:RNA polymerase sigma-70 factor (ECF subfamily)